MVPPLVCLGTSLQMVSVKRTLGSILSCSHEPQRWMSVTGPVLVQRKSSASVRFWLAFTSTPLGTFGYWTNLTPLVSGQHGGGGGGWFVAVLILNARSRPKLFGS